MAKQSAIEWTQNTWNPWHGCHKVSQGCKNCYMFREKKHYGQDPNVVVRSKTTFYDPLKWPEPQLIFTCSWSDFFIEESDPWRDEAFAIMALTPHHTYQVLTKRPDRMLAYLNDPQTPGRIAQIAIGLRRERKITFPNAEFCTEPLGYGDPGAEWFPLRNVWLGVSVEDQKTADERIPQLVQSPAAKRFLSAEPLLGPIDISNFISQIDWVIGGGESGPEARPTHPDWLRSLRDQCTAAGVPFFFKQWGEWLPFEETGDAPFYRNCSTGIEYDGHGMNFFDDDRDGPGKFMGARWMDAHEAVAFNIEFDAADCSYLRVGKKAAGRLLDGREWNEMPIPQDRAETPAGRSACI